MAAPLYAYPDQAAVERRVPKSKIYAHARPTRRIKDAFVAEADQIVWAYKLAPETLNLPARPGAAEIQVFRIALKTSEVSEAVLRTIDKAIPLPVIHEVTYSGRVKSIAAYKRPSEADSAKWVIGEYFHSEWHAAQAPREPLPVALDLAKLYEHLVRSHLRIPARPGESLDEHTGRVTAIRAKERECSRLEARMRQEKQFNRKVELNSMLRKNVSELDALRSDIPTE